MTCNLHTSSCGGKHNKNKSRYENKSNKSVKKGEQKSDQIRNILNL